MITENQIAALKYMVFNSKDGTELSKRVLAFLIDQSEGLTKEVCLTLVADREGYTADEIKDAGHGVGSMESCNCTTHLNELFALMGSELFSSICYGDFDPARTGNPLNNDGQFAGFDVSMVNHPRLIREGMPSRYTFWLSKELYSCVVTLVVATREDLEKINLKRPGLYPSLEREVGE